MEKIRLEDRQKHVKSYKKAVKQAIKSVKKENQVTKQEFYLFRFENEKKRYGVKNSNKGLMSRYEWKLLENILNHSMKLGKTQEVKQALHKKKIAYSLLEHTF